MFVLGALSVEIANSKEYKWHSVFRGMAQAEPVTIAAPFILSDNLDVTFHGSFI